MTLLPKQVRGYPHGIVSGGGEKGILRQGSHILDPHIFIPQGIISAPFTVVFFAGDSNVE